MTVNPFQSQGWQTPILCSLFQAFISEFDRLCLELFNEILASRRAQWRPWPLTASISGAKNGSKRPAHINQGDKGEALEKAYRDIAHLQHAIHIRPGSQISERSRGAGNCVLFNSIIVARPVFLVAICSPLQNWIYSMTREARWASQSSMGSF